MANDLYFIHDNNIKSFYGKGGAWLPYATAKTQQARLCVFGSVEDARECMSHNGLARKAGVSILNAKTTRSKLNVKKINPAVKPNWRVSEPPAPKKATVPAPKKPAPSVPPNPTYCSYLDSIQGDEKSGFVIHSDIAEKLMNTELIRDTLAFADMSQKIAESWSSRMDGIEEKIRNCDLRICDELHKLEFEEEMSDKALIETAKRLQEIRRQRRVAKNEKAVGEMMIEITEKSEMTSQIRHLKDFIVSAKDRMYRVRVPEAYVSKEEITAE